MVPIGDISSQTDGKIGATDDSIPPFELFKTSYTLQESAFWLTEFQSPRSLHPAWKWRPNPFKNPPPQLPQEMLTIQTKYVDKVTDYVSQPFNYSWSEVKKMSLELARWFTSYCHHLRLSSQETDNESIRAFCQTILGGICSRADRYQEAGAIDLSPLEDWLQRLLRALSGTSDWFESVEADISHDGVDEDFFAPPNPFFEDIRVAIDGRVFFLTTNGSMGLGPASMEEGDVIHVFPSGRTHFILREDNSWDASIYHNCPRWMLSPATGHYELVGECYLHSSDAPETQSRDGENEFVKGSLPFEILGSNYLQNMSSGIQTIALI